MKPISVLQAWLQTQPTGFLVSVNGGVDVPVGPEDWIVDGDAITYLYAYGDRLHTIHVVKAVVQEEQVDVETDAPHHVTFSYWWTDDQADILDGWSKARVLLDVPRMLQDAIGAGAP